MRILTVVRILGVLLLGFSFFMLPPAACALFYAESEWQTILLSFCISAGTAFAMIRADRNPRSEISSREGLAIVSLAWVACSFFGGLPYMLGSPALSLTDSYFEVMSGMTTTGASILSDIEAMPKSLLLWRSVTHWLGGMGIIVLGLAILPILGIGGMELFKAEVSGPSDEDKLTPKIKDTAKILWQVYLGMTIILVLLLLGGGMELFDAVNHSMATVSSGGFSTKNASIAHYQSPYLHWVLSVFMLLAAMNYYLHWYAITGRLQLIWQDLEARFFIFLIGICTLFLVITLMYSGVYTDLEKCIREVFFVVSATFSSTGFGLADYELWPVSCQILIFGILFVGGCAGSTSGGIKIIRHLILAKFAYQQLYLLIHPRAVARVKIGDQVITAQVLFGVLGFVVLWFGLYALGTLAMGLCGLDFITANSAVASCLCNVGPGLGAVGPLDNFGHISTIGKWILSFLMLLGRLEILTIVVLFTPVFWKD